MSIAQRAWGDERSSWQFYFTSKPRGGMVSSPEALWDNLMIVTEDRMDRMDRIVDPVRA